MLKKCQGRAPRRGLSIVELMVGVAVGMVVTSGALTLFARNLGGSRQLLLESRVNQDLRNAADLVTRDLRRAGYWGNAIQGTLAIGATSATTPNPYNHVTAPSSSEIAYEFSKDSLAAAEDDTVNDSERFGFRLNDGVLQMKTAADLWTNLTDEGAIKVTKFTITPTETKLALGNLCPKVCVNGVMPNCPEMTVRRYAILLQGKSKTDSTVVRNLRSIVRMRNDTVSGQCPA